MDDWIDYYDSTHTIYASKRHRDLHFEVIARDIIGYISSRDAVVLDYSCGEALSAARVAEACGMLILAEPAPGVRGRLIARFAPNTKIRVRSLEDVRKMHEKSIDLVVMNSVAQYMTPQELDSALAIVNRLLKPAGRLVLGDILRPEVGMGRDVARAVTLCGETRFPEGRADRAALDRFVGLPPIACESRADALQRGRDHREACRSRIQRFARASEYRPQSLAHHLFGAPRVGPRLERDRAPVSWLIMIFSKDP